MDHKQKQCLQSVGTVYLVYNDFDKIKHKKNIVFLLQISHGILKNIVVIDCIQLQTCMTANT